MASLRSAASRSRPTTGLAWRCVSRRCAGASGGLNRRCRLLKRESDRRKNRVKTFLHTVRIPASRICPSQTPLVRHPHAPLMHERKICGLTRGRRASIFASMDFPGIADDTWQRRGGKPRGIPFAGIDPTQDTPIWRDVYAVLRKKLKRGNHSRRMRGRDNIAVVASTADYIRARCCRRPPVVNWRLQTQGRAAGYLAGGVIRQQR